ncbi:MAG: hypothetical protein H6988_07875 [Pseudomonadales bacterium]|nr:hypothetical protein [Halieaceae bacterium]MCP5190298.1 hypothetical protein [Pseudomonadales bacterium]
MGQGEDSLGNIGSDYRSQCSLKVDFNASDAVRSVWRDRPASRTRLLRGHGAVSIFTRMTVKS